MLGDVVTAISRPEGPLTDGVVALRPFDERDLPAIDEGLRDREIQRWFDVSRLTAREYLERKTRAWVNGEAASFAVCDAADHQACLGQVFIELDDDGRADVGYWLLPAARGRGLAVRAVALAAEWAFREGQIARLQLRAEPANVASVRVAERCRFRAEGVLRSFIERDGIRRDVVLYSLLPRDISADSANPS